MIGGSRRITERGCRSLGTGGWGRRGRQAEPEMGSVARRGGGRSGGGWRGVDPRPAASPKEVKHNWA